MKRERVECPFCSELIMQDAVKCRFCREWLPASQPGGNGGRVIEEIDRAEPHLGALEEVRNSYLATIEGTEKRSGSIERIGHQAGSPADRDYSYDDSTVEAPERVERDRPDHSGRIEKIWRRTEPLEDAQSGADSPADGDGGSAGEQQTSHKVVEESAVPSATETSSAETLESATSTKETHIEEPQQGSAGLAYGDDSPAGEQHNGEELVEESAVTSAADMSSPETLESEPIIKWPPIEDTQHEASGLTGSDDSSTETLESNRIMEWSRIKDTQYGTNGLADSDYSACEHDNGEEAVEESAARVVAATSPEETPESGPVRNKESRVPWLRILLLLLYLGAGGALVVSEVNARRSLRAAQAKESTQENEAAFAMYRHVLDAFPFSLVTIEARQSLSRLCEAESLDMPKASWLGAVEKLLGRKADIPYLHLLPSMAWPVSAILLLLVVVTRIFRPGVAFLALLLMVVALAGSLVQLASYGAISLPPATGAAQRFMQATPAVYFTSYLLLLLTALMTLTATTKRPKTQTEDLEVEELWEKIDCGEKE